MKNFVVKKKRIIYIIYIFKHKLPKSTFRDQNKMKNYTKFVSIWHMLEKDKIITCFCVNIANFVPSSLLAFTALRRRFYQNGRTETADRQKFASERPTACAGPITLKLYILVDNKLS